MHLETLHGSPTAASTPEPRSHAGTCANPSTSLLCTGCSGNTPVSSLDRVRRATNRRMHAAPPPTLVQQYARSEQQPERKYQTEICALQLERTDEQSR